LDFLCEITGSLGLDVTNDLKVLKDCVIKLRVKLCVYDDMFCDLTVK
jgi:hypothetical protein